uniref:Methionine aminopeptidase n=1 Tax=Clastoptera arizonana TaxID=38151 RepID=A0A1B6E9Y8_9HEMI
MLQTICKNIYSNLSKMNILKSTVVKRNRSFLRNCKRRKFGNYSIVEPGEVSTMKSVPPHITVPSYYKSTVPAESPKYPEIKDNDQILRMRHSCQIAREVLNTVGKQLKVGMTTDEIDCIVHDLCIEHNAYPSPLNYRSFPKSVCTSVNNVACHGIPDNRRLCDGDIINIDVTVYTGGFHGDCSSMFLIGNVDSEGCRLVTATRDALDQAILICRPKQSFSAIGEAIDKVAASHGFNVIPCFLGHGIGSYFHGPPDIYHTYSTEYPGEMLSGMTFTIEPVLTQGSKEVIILEDGWTAVSADKARSAQWEETVLITDSGVEVLTK